MVRDNSNSVFPILFQTLFLILIIMSLPALVAGRPGPFIDDIICEENQATLGPAINFARAGEGFLRISVVIGVTACIGFCLVIALSLFCYFDEKKHED